MQELETLKGTLPFVSIVVIGRNEANNLDNTFQAIQKMDYPASKLEVLYVDTDSSDNSVKIAKKYTPSVFEEHSVWPSSGLARNRGIKESTYDIIHFIDGDIAIAPDYLKQAVRELHKPGIDAVTGYFEEHNTSSYFNRIMAIRRDDIRHERHFCESTNGGGTYLRAPLISVDGYDERILKGQESELGYRFRRAGYHILFIDSIQGIHDFDLTGVRDFFRSKYLYGRSFGFLLKLRDDLNGYIQRLRRTAYKTIINNTASVLLIIASILSGYYWIILLYYLSRLSYLFVSNKIIKKKTFRQLTYSLIQYIFSFASYLGILSVLLDSRYHSIKKQRITKTQMV